MTTSGHCLPAEVWLNIFYHIQDKRQLGQCKLVCKMWKPLAEMAMLKTIVLTETNLPKLYQYLVKYPKSSQHIRAIQFQHHLHSSTPYLRAFLTVAMTPYLKTIDVEFCTDGIFDILADITAQKPPNYLKLEQIPSIGLSKYAYGSLVYQLRKTLQSLHARFVPESQPSSIRRIISNLSQFENLTDLHVFDQVDYIDSIPQLDGMLKGCPNLITLTLEINLPTSGKPFEGHLDAWLLQNVQKVNSLKTMCISYTDDDFEEYPNTTTFGLFHVDVLQYLSFKYPKVEHFDMKGYAQKNQPIIQSLFENAGTVRLRNWMIDSIDHVQDMIDIWKSKRNSLEIGYSYMNSTEGYVCEMGAAKEDNHTKFTLQHIPWNVPVERIRQLVLSLSKTLTKDFEIILEEYEGENIQHIRPLSFLQFMPSIERLKLYSKTLGQELPLAPLTRLQTLILEGIDLTAKEVADIASWAPCLRHLTLTHCTYTTYPLGSSGSLDQNIALPELALDTLTMNGVMSSQDLRISLVTSKSQTQLFYTEPFGSTVKTTLKERNLRIHDVTISIECKSLKHLSVQWGRVTMEMEFDERGNVVASDPAIVNSTITELKQDLQTPSTENAPLKTKNQALTTNYKQTKRYLTEAQIQAIEKPDI